MYPKPLPKDPVQAKIVMRLCYGFVREIRAWQRITDDNELYNREHKLIAKRIRDLRYHIERYFPATLIMACESMYADSQNDFDKYKGASWTHEQAKKTWGNHVDNWRRGKRVQNLITFGTLSDIPF